jgi:hypothetical protein
MADRDPETVTISPVVDDEEDPMSGTTLDAVFVATITEARAEGKSYETFRDTIRRGWRPDRAASR